MLKYMTIGRWFSFVIGIIVIIAGFITWILLRKNSEKEARIAGITAFVIALFFGLIMTVGPVIRSNTETGKREYKDQISEYTSGISRTVRVYDMNGNLIETYTGKFDIERRDGSILFDDENGKRHIIYYSTGTILVDEN